MRTTVTIDDQLYRRTKAEAAKTGRTVGQVIEDALRQSWARRPASEDAPSIVPFGGDGVLPGVDLSDNAALRDLMDDGEPISALR